MRLRNLIFLSTLGLGISAFFFMGERSSAREPAGKSKPNILIIMGDDIGYWNLSYNNAGMMGYKTPNIDRIANEGMKFTDYYGQQSCTAGRAALILGQSPVRTGLTKVGLPAAKVGISDKDPTIAELLKPHGYATGQFGKNHLGDRNEYLPTVHGFDEFFGNLYHLNAEEEPQNPNYPQDPAFQDRFGPRGVLKTKATQTFDNTEDPRFGVVGKQSIEDTGPLTIERMKTIDYEFLAAAKDFIKRNTEEGKPWMTYFNSTRMHFFTHIRDDLLSEAGFYADGMMEHDRHVGELLALIEELKISENTIVLYTTDNGPHYNEWPDGGITPFRGEKNTNWEGAFRVPAAVRWPGHIQPGSVSNSIVSHEDWIPTLLAAVGQPDIKEKLLDGYTIGDKTYKVHLDGYNLKDYLAGNAENPRRDFYYFSDDGAFLSLRYDDWKLVFKEQRSRGMAVWRDPFVDLRAPKIFHLRRDPFERADTDSNNYNHWWVQRAFLIVPAQTLAKTFLETFREFPPRQKPASFNLDEVMDTVSRPIDTGSFAPEKPEDFYVQ